MPVPHNETTADRSVACPRVKNIPLCSERLMHALRKREKKGAGLFGIVRYWYVGCCESRLEYARTSDRPHEKATQLCLGAPCMLLSMDQVGVFLPPLGYLHMRGVFWCKELDISHRVPSTLGVPPLMFTDYSKRLKLRGEHSPAAGGCGPGSRIASSFPKLARSTPPELSVTHSAAGLVSPVESKKIVKRVGCHFTTLCSNFFTSKSAFHSDGSQFIGGQMKL